MLRKRFRVLEEEDGEDAATTRGSAHGQDAGIKRREQNRLKGSLKYVVLMFVFLIVIVLAVSVLLVMAKRRPGRNEYVRLPSLFSFFSVSIKATSDLTCLMT